MGLRCGIVGLPNVGKSTLFNAVTQTASAEAANYPFCTIEPNIGIVSVPDTRLDEIARIGGSAEIIQTQIEFVDIAGLVRGASKGEGLGNQFLSHIREVDAVVHMLRCFKDDDVTHVEGDVDPIRDAEIIELEPVLYVCNVSEDEVADGNEFVRKVEAKAAAENAKAIWISAKIESEIAVLDSEEEKEMFLESIGLKETGLAKLIRAAYQLLGLITYFTVGPKEARAWTIHNGMVAPQAAGVIHTDFEKGFIRAETIAYDDYVKYKGEAGSKEVGKLRLEGKEYIVKDGDVMHFRFNT